MTHLCPKWNQVKDLSNYDLAKFLKSNDDELTWYLQLLRERESSHEKQKGLLEKSNTKLKKGGAKVSNKTSLINQEIEKLNEIKNRLSDENDGLKDTNGNLEQEIVFLKELLSVLEKEQQSKLKK
jgi:hypothetical protein